MSIPISQLIPPIFPHATISLFPTSVTSSVLYVSFLHIFLDSTGKQYHDICHSLSELLHTV